jgi:hypothetical protein
MIVARVKWRSDTVEDLSRDEHSVTGISRSNLER